MRAELASAVLMLSFCASDAGAQVPPLGLGGVDAAVTEAVQRFGLPDSWIRAVMRRESGGDPSATSPKGAMGLMQLMPDTWAQLRRELTLGADPYDVHDNVVAGAAYLRRLYDEFGPEGFLAAYNAGPGRYLDLVRKGRALPDETRTYVAVVTRAIASGPPSPQPGAMPALGVPPPPPPTIFVHLGDNFRAVSSARTGLFPSLAGGQSQ